MSFAMVTSGQVALQLGAACGHDMDCQDSIKQSQCSMVGLCECKPYYAQFNETSCVQGEWIFFSSSFIGGNFENIGGWPQIREWCQRPDVCVMRSFKRRTFSFVSTNVELHALSVNSTTFTFTYTHRGHVGPRQRQQRAAKNTHLVADAIHGCSWIYYSWKRAWSTFLSAFSAKRQSKQTHLAHGLVGMHFSSRVRFFGRNLWPANNVGAWTSKEKTWSACAHLWPMLIQFFDSNSTAGGNNAFWSMHPFSTLCLHYKMETRKK